MAYDFHWIDPYVMLASVPHWIIAQWAAWYSLHNLIGPSLDPEYRGDVRIAIPMAILANHWREEKPIHTENMMAFPPPKPAQTPEEQRAALEAMAAASKRSASRQASSSKDTKPSGTLSAKTVHHNKSRSRRSRKGLQHGESRAERNQQSGRTVAE